MYFDFYILIDSYICFFLGLPVIVMGRIEVLFAGVAMALLQVHAEVFW